MNLRSLIFVAAGVALLAALFFLFRPQPVGSPATVPTPAAASRSANATASTTAAAPAVALEAVSTPAPVQRFEIVVAKDRRVSGPDVIRVNQGDTLVLRVTSDQHDELHLHGYDRTLKLHPGKAAELELVADRSGRFDYELHHAHLDLGALEVMPR